MFGCKKNWEAKYRLVLITSSRALNRDVQDVSDN